MSEMILDIAAEAEKPTVPGCSNNVRRTADQRVVGLPEHSYPGRKAGASVIGKLSTKPVREQAAATESASGYQEKLSPHWREHDYEEKRQRRTYRGRTITMLRRYMRYSMETGRLPSILGREFFRAKVTSYTVVTFEDRVIFVHDMETCLNRLDEFSREIIARHILQEHDQAATARLLNCAERTIRTYVPMVLDLLSDILLEVGLLEPTDSTRRKSCQGGQNDEKRVSGCERWENKS